VWLSSQRLDPYNVHERCNLGARQRWGIETSLLVEKCQGYHYLMRLAHLLNALALGHQTGGEPSAHTGRTGVFALGARELRASLATG
jgi:hypothetical protein